MRRAAQSKVKIFDQRPDFPREFPYYLDSNRFLSNLPGSHDPFSSRGHDAPIHQCADVSVDRTRWAPPGLFGRSQFLFAGRRCKWIRNGFMNKNIKLPLGYVGTMRTRDRGGTAAAKPYADAAGDGARRLDSLFDLADLPCCPRSAFTYVTPHYRGLDFFRWGTFKTEPRKQPIGLPPYIECMCPPYYQSMADAVQTRSSTAKYKAGRDLQLTTPISAEFSRATAARNISARFRITATTLSTAPKISAPISTSGTNASPLIATRFMRPEYGCRRITSICTTTTRCSTAATPRRSESISSAGTAQ